MDGNPASEDSSWADLLEVPTEPARETSVLGPTIVLRGELSAGEDLIIRGEIQGTVVGTDTVVLKKSARLHGLISAAQIRLEDGVNFDDVVLAGNIAQTAAD
jgi:cytoskeletal protein CcmA (bactofilin family)